MIIIIMLLVAEFRFLNDSYNIKEDSGNVSICLELVHGTIEGANIGLSVNASLSKLCRN